MKKIISLLLTGVMTVAMCVPAFASENLHVKNNATGFEGYNTPTSVSESIEAAVGDFPYVDVQLYDNEENLDKIGNVDFIRQVGLLYVEKTSGNWYGYLAGGNSYKWNGRTWDLVDTLFEGPSGGGCGSDTPCAPAEDKKEEPAVVKEAKETLAQALELEVSSGLKGENNPYVQAAVRSIGSDAQEKLVSALLSDGDVEIGGVKVPATMFRQSDYLQKAFISVYVTSLGLGDKILGCDGSMIMFLNADGTVSMISLF